VTFVAQIVTIGEQKVCPESESLKFSTTPTPQVENPSYSDSTALPKTQYAALGHLFSVGLFVQYFQCLIDEKS